ncbi:MAG: uncharacterized protein KVP18_002094 [Porospora cf. gigantea A]|uniref:uncharacterized protein n=2 Tax=Porospora cf. gigantea A TaxID=2853593 RepID=UPI003559E997|nr:MAG: hypothetical protein KVP18_002094 [Porospora cf. gigantea A]
MMDEATTYIHSGSQPDRYGSLTTPVYATSTFSFESAEQGGRRFAGEEDGFIYSRFGNPTVAVAERKLAAMEGAESAVAFASGMGAITSVIWTVLKAGDHVISDAVIYGCTYKFLSHGLTKFGVDVTFIDTSDLDAVRAAMRPNTKVVFLETPANPNLKIADIAAVSDIAHQTPGCLVLVDNTFASPYLQKPLELGADVALHSATKFLNGHGDVIAGFAAGSSELMLQVRLEGLKDMTGATMGARDASMVIRGMKTLSFRMERHCANAKVVAEFLNNHPAITQVYWPGLKTHPCHEVAARQMRDFGSIMAFELHGGVEAGKTVLNNLKLCTLAVSLGDCETLIQHPASMTHAAVPREKRLQAGITDGLVRLSVGLEDPQDIIDDLRQGLNMLDSTLKGRSPSDASTQHTRTAKNTDENVSF